MTKTILITGAAGNLGKAVVEKFSAEGHRVIAVASPERDLGYPINNSASIYHANLANEKEVEELLDKILSLGTIDAAILTVGGFAMGSIASTRGDAIQKMIELNFNTAYFTARPLFKHMLANLSGRIILVGARPALIAKEGKNTVAYALSKSLIFKLAELLNAEGVAKNVLTSVIVPSIIDTPVNRQAMPNADFSKWLSPEKISSTIYTLVMEERKAEQNPVVAMY